METLIGLFITCSFSVSSWHPVLNMPVKFDVGGISCRVIDDRLPSVGSVEWSRTPILIDCSEALEWLNPLNLTRTIMFFKEDGDCNYDI